VRPDLWTSCLWFFELSEGPIGGGVSRQHLI
jgi:hypothetical protein